MANKIDIQLTDDPLMNIYMMTHILNDRSREAMSYLMFGYYLGSTQSQPPLNTPTQKKVQNE